MTRQTRTDLKIFVPAGILIALFLAGFLSFYASTHPDGLTKIAGEVVPGIAAQEQEHPRGDSTFAGYGTEGVANDRLAGAIAGLSGVVLTLAVSGLLFFAVRRRGSSAGADSRSGDSATPSSG